MTKKVIAMAAPEALSSFAILDSGQIFVYASPEFSDKPHCEFSHILQLASFLLG
jgi:hypothetical protein